MPMTKKLYKSEEREALVTLFHQSGLIKKEFCQQEWLSYSMFKRWCRGQKSSSSLRPEKFYRLSLPAAAAPFSEPLNPSSLRLSFPNGCRLELPEHYPVASLRGLLGLGGELC